MIIFYSMIFISSTTHTMEKITHDVEKHLKKAEKRISSEVKQIVIDQPVSVQYNCGISDGEHAFLQKRLPIVKAALEKLLNRSLEEKQVPNIAFICSGGGYRAMLCTTGSLCGAQKIGLLDAITYTTALSGSTWAVAPWISSGLSIEEFKTYIQKCASKEFMDLTLEEQILMLQALEKQYFDKQSLTFVDPYGALLANRLLKILKDDRQTTTLSQQAEKIKHGLYPYPIYTAIDGRESITTGQTWYEFTPHAIGDRINNTQIPALAYGRKFKNGQSVNDKPEKPLAYHMGTWGSAFGANIYEILNNVIKNKKILEMIRKLIPDSVEGDRLLDFYAEISNYMYKMNDIKDTTLSTTKHMKFVDAGLEINLPYLPVSGICSERTPDILIFLDASAGHVGGVLQKVVNCAQKYNRPFPNIDFTDIDKKTISIFKDEHNKKVPLILYMPRISDEKLWQANKDKPEFAGYNLTGFDLDKETNDGFCETINFQYSPEHSKLVVDQTEFNMRVNKDVIIQEINQWIDKQ
jgi:phospholipase A2